MKNKRGACSLVDYDIQDGEERDATLQGPIVEDGKTIMQGQIYKR